MGFPFEDEFGILGCVMNRQVKQRQGNEVFLKDVKIYKCKDVPWRV